MFRGGIYMLWVPSKQRQKEKKSSSISPTADFPHPPAQHAAMGLKLRVRVAGAAAAQTIEVPEVCTLAQLRKAVATKCFEGACEPSAVGDLADTLLATSSVTTSHRAHAHGVRLPSFRGTCIQRVWQLFRVSGTY